MCEARLRGVVSCGACACSVGNVSAQDAQYADGAVHVAETRPGGCHSRGATTMKPGGRQVWASGRRAVGA